MREWTREEKYRYLKDPQELKELYDRISKSQYRQTFHNQAVTGLMNDPNGFVWHDNRWHLFYQWCPWGAVHGLKHWYHIISKDLVTWKNLGVCLLPDQEDGYDNKGVYSGSAMPIEDKIYLYYTGNHRDADWTRHAYTCLARLGNDGDAVFTSRIFPTGEEHFLRIEGDTFNRMWTLKPAVKEQFLI